MTQDTKNLFLAMALSLLVIVGWQHFFGSPKMQNARQTQAQLDKAPGAPGQPAVAPSRRRSPIPPRPALRPT